MRSRLRTETGNSRLLLQQQLSHDQLAKLEPVAGFWISKHLQVLYYQHIRFPDWGCHTCCCLLVLGQHEPNNGGNSTLSQRAPVEWKNEEKQEHVNCVSGRMSAVPEFSAFTAMCLTVFPAPSFLCLVWRWVLVLKNGLKVKSFTWKKVLYLKTRLKPFYQYRVLHTPANRDGRTWRPQRSAPVRSKQPMLSIALRWGHCWPSGSAEGAGGNCTFATSKQTNPSDVAVPFTRARHPSLSSAAAFCKPKAPNPLGGHVFGRVVAASPTAAAA